jgi:hypothetical protein
MLYVIACIFGRRESPPLILLGGLATAARASAPRPLGCSPRPVNFGPARVPAPRPLRQCAASSRDQPQDGHYVRARGSGRNRVAFRPHTLPHVVCSRMYIRKEGNAPPHFGGELGNGKLGSVIPIVAALVPPGGLLSPCMVGRHPQFSTFKDTGRAQPALLLRGGHERLVARIARASVLGGSLRARPGTCFVSRALAVPARFFLRRAHGWGGLDYTCFHWRAARSPAGGDRRTLVTRGAGRGKARLGPGACPTDNICCTATSSCLPRLLPSFMLPVARRPSVE